MSNKISTGAEFIDNYLDGGYEKGVVTTIYGPAGSGKTNLCLLAAVRVAETGKKVVLIDTEGGVAVERIKQLSGNWEAVLNEIIFLQPLNFNEQQEMFNKLRPLVSEELEVGLIVVDSISMLYRLELGKAEAVFETNSALARQIATLVEIARNKSIPVLITNQVYADFGDRNKVKMVGGDLLKYGGKCLIELSKEDLPENSTNCNNYTQHLKKDDLPSEVTLRFLTLRKHRYLVEGKRLKFRIVSSGVVDVTN